MTTQEKFHAAVNVIRSLPKNGSYQPSNELMLRFYAYFKQATEGPCSEAGTSKPAFWDVVGRAKHTAWARLKNMPREEAMQRYVEELHRIVETMSYTDNVATFMRAGDQDVLDQLPLDDLELVAGDCLKHVRSQPGSPLASRPSSPAPDSDEDEYIDTIEAEPDVILTKSVPLTNGYASDNPQITHLTNGTANRGMGGSRNDKQKSQIDISAEVARVVASLQSDLRTLDARVATLERDSRFSKANRIVSFPNLSPTLLAFIVIWPFVALHLNRRFFSK